MTRINPNELNDLQLYITTPRCYLVIVYNRERHPLIGRRLENLDSCPSTLISPCFSNRQGGETEVEQRCVLSPAGTRGFLAGNGDTRDRSFLSSLPQSAFGPRSTGMGDIGGETIGALARYQCDLRANNLVDEEDGGGVVFVLPACAPFIKRRENWTGGSR